MILKEKEYETKVLISKKVFSKVLKNYNFNLLDNKLIKNNYFDTFDLKVFNSAAVFRIRETADKITITFKKALKRNELIEHNQQVDAKRLAKIKLNKFKRSKFKGILKENGIDIEHVGYLGTLITHRWKMEYNGAYIFIDHAVYNNIEDYEIECEGKSTKDAEKTLRKFCRENNINFSVKSLSKYTRFLKSREGGI